MATERRGNRRHYYDKVRDGDTVRSHHIAPPLARYFAGLAAAQNARLRRKRAHRSIAEDTTAELKRLLGHWDTLQAALLYAGGFYRQSGSWRPHVRAKLFRASPGDTPGDTPGNTRGDAPVHCSSTPEGPASRAAAELASSLQQVYRDGGLDHLDRLDRAFGTLGEIVGGLDRRDAAPGDLWALRHAHLRPLFDAWMRRASRLNADLLARIGPMAPDADGEVRLSDAQRDLLSRARRCAGVEHDGRTWAWNGAGADPRASSGGDPLGGYPLGIVATVAAAAARLTALDHLTLGAYRGLRPGTYSEKQWALALKPARARQVRAKRHFCDVVRRDKRHVAALVDAGDLVHLDGFVGDPPEPADEWATHE